MCIRDRFRALNVGCMLDEARATGTDECLLVHGERSIWRKSKRKMYYSKYGLHEQLTCF